MNVVLERHVDQCPGCEGLVTDENMKAGPVQRVLRYGRPFLKQTVTLTCPHCDKVTKKTLHERLRDPRRDLPQAKRAAKARKPRKPNRKGA